MVCSIYNGLYQCSCVVPGKGKRKKPADMVLKDAETVAPSALEVIPDSEEGDIEELTKKSSKRRRSSPARDQEEPIKRKRGQPSHTKQVTDPVKISNRKSLPKSKAETYLPQGNSASTSRRRSSTKNNGRVSSGAISDDEIMLGSPPLDPAPSNLSPNHMPPTANLPENSLPEGIQAYGQGEGSDLLFDQPESISANDKSLQLPSHRARAAKPLIKIVDDVTLEVNGGIATKTRLISQTVEASSSSTPSRVSTRTKPKNRSSLLTFENGALKTRKGKFMPTETGIPSEQRDCDLDAGPGDDTMEVDGVLSLDSSPIKIPSGEELLQMAGLKVDDITALPDFDEHEPAVVAFQNPSENLAQSR